MPVRNFHDAVRLVATDLDGTLLSPAGVVTSRTAEAVRAARRSGLHVIPCTGRPAKSVWHLADHARLGPLGVCSNGAALVDLARREVLEVDAFTDRDAVEVVAVVRSSEPSVRLAFDDDLAFTHERGFFERRPDWDETLVAVDDLTAAFDGRVTQLIARRPGLSAAQLIDRLRPVLAERVTLTTSGLDWVDLCLPLVSKAARLAVVCERLGIAPAEVVAIGDNHNDLSMMAWAGTAMAVANAVDEVRAVADRVLPSNAEHGVAVLIEELLA